MARSPTPEEAGAINLSKEADIPDLWSAQTTRLTPMPSDGRTVGKQVASVVLGDPHDNPGGMVLDDMDAEALMDTREGRRIMDLIEGEAKQSVTLEMQEKINAQIRQDADSAELADRYSLLRQMSFEQGDNDQAIKARAQRSREDVSSRTRWYRTRDETAVPTTAANADEHLVSHTTEQFGERR